MALGDGIRRNIALISNAERTKFINAILKMDTTKFFPERSHLLGQAGGNP